MKAHGYVIYDKARDVYLNQNNIMRQFNCTVKIYHSIWAANRKKDAIEKHYQRLLNPLKCNLMIRTIRLEMENEEA